VLALTAGVATSAPAQNAWQAEVGIQGGYSKVKRSGTGVSDAGSFFMIPGAATVAPILTYGSVYAIIPWKNKIAVEPTVGFSQLSIASGATAARLGLRVDYAISPKFYGGAGGVLNYIEQSGSNGTQLGVQLGFGYRMKIARGLNGRIEAQWVSTKKGDNVTGPFNAYSVLVGVSSKIGGRAATPARRAATDRLWSQAIGVNAGYSRVHIVGGGGDATFLSAPGIGNSMAGLGAYAPGPTTLFAILPIGRKAALEPGLDITSADANGTGANLSVGAALRLDYAVSGGWYGAVGGQLSHVNPNVGPSASVLGGSLAWGYRFHLTGDFGGRVEMNYLTFPQNNDLGVATNTFSVLFGATMPLK
jgi:hypothetical protein